MASAAIHLRYHDARRPRPSLPSNNKERQHAQKVIPRAEAAVRVFLNGVFMMLKPIRPLLFMFLLVTLVPVFANGQTADLSLTKEDSPDPVTAGASLTYTITVNNEGPNDAATVEMSDPLPTGTTFQSISTPAGWSCTTPAVGVNGTVSCTIATFVPGSAIFVITVNVGAGLANGTVLTNTASVTSTTTDPHPGSESASADTTISAPVSTFSFTKTDAPDPVLAGANLTYTLTATNSNGADLESATLTDTLPTGTTFVSLSSPGGWTCSTPAVGASGAISCTATPWPVGSAAFTLIVHVDPAFAAGSSISNVGTLAVTDSGRSNSLVASTTTQVLSPASLSATKTVSGSFLPGGAVTYTVVLTNSSASAQSDNPGAEFADILPAQLNLVSATATSGTAVATPATNTVTWNGSIPGNGSVTITIQATAKSKLNIGSTVTNQGSVAYDADGNGTNEASANTDDPAMSGAANPTSFVIGAATVVAVPVLDEKSLAFLALLLALGGAALLRARI